jgi:hypothetical protein
MAATTVGDLSALADSPAGDRLGFDSDGQTGQQVNMQLALGEWQWGIRLLQMFGRDL